MTQHQGSSIDATSVGAGDPAGFADVCGVLLPVREKPDFVSRDALHHRLVVTPTVERNLEAAVLALCQGRPLLLEGPPGALYSSLRPKANKDPYTNVCSLYSLYSFALLW